MQLVRTTLRLKPDLKKAAEKQAIDQNTTLQAIFNQALEQYLAGQTYRKVRKIIFKGHHLGVPLDNLTRDDIYEDPS